MSALKRILLFALPSIWTITLASEKAPTPVQFAWFTDTHVGSSTGAADLGVVVADVNQQGAAEFVIVSGDISELDAGDNLHRAKLILDSLSVPYHIIPGNHDTKWSTSGAEMFTRLWGSDRFNFEVGGVRFIGIHQGPIMRMADGYIDPADIAWVETILGGLPDPRQKIFIVTHYPLDPSVDNWFALRDVIRPYNIQAILHGHGHRNRVGNYEGVPGIMSRSTLQRGQQPIGYTHVKMYPVSASFYERLPANDSLHHWYTLGLGDRNFADSLKLPNPDFSENTGSGVVLEWQVETGAIITSSATLNENKVFVANTQGTVYALDQRSGELSWTWHGQGANHSTPAVARKRVVFGSTDSTITCLSELTGDLKWQRKTSGAVLGSPLIHKSMVYIGSGDGVFTALKLRTGKLKWAYKDINGYIETKPVLAEGKIMFGAWDGGFYALDAKKGKLIWRWSDGPKGLLYSPAACWPVVSGSTVFIVAPDRVMSAIDLNSGATLWRKAGHKVRETIGISQDGETVFARTMQDTTFAIHAAAEDFELRWIRHTGFDYDISPNAMVEREGHLFFSTKDGWVYCLDSETGATLWRYRVSDGLVNTVTPVSGSEVICTAADGRVSYLRFEP